MLLCFFPLINVKNSIIAIILFVSGMLLKSIVEFQHISCAQDDYLFYPITIPSFYRGDINIESKRVIYFFEYRNKSLNVHEWDDIEKYANIFLNVTFATLSLCCLPNLILCVQSKEFQYIMIFLEIFLYQISPMILFLNFISIVSET